MHTVELLFFSFFMHIHTNLVTLLINALVFIVFRCKWCGWRRDVRKNWPTNPKGPAKNKPCGLTNSALTVKICHFSALLNRSAFGSYLRGSLISFKITCSVLVLSCEVFCVLLYIKWYVTGEDVCLSFFVEPLGSVVSGYSRGLT